jgi:hypothetical protein
MARSDMNDPGVLEAIHILLAVTAAAFGALIADVTVGDRLRCGCDWCRWERDR